MDEPTGDAAAIDALLPALRLREHEAFHDLYDLMAGQLIGYAHARLADRHTAEDVVQDVFVRLTRHARRFRGDGKALLAWLYRTTSRRCTDVHRRRARRKETSVARPQMFLAHRPAYTQAVWAIDDPALEAALDELTADQREALLLRRVAGLDGDEVAAIMKKSRDAVYALCARAESRLRDRLQQPALPKAEAMPRPGVTVSVIPPGARRGRGAGAPPEPDEGEVLEGDVVRGAEPPAWERHLLPDEADIEDAVTIVADTKAAAGGGPEPGSDADAAVAAWEAAREKTAQQEAQEEVDAVEGGDPTSLQAEAAARAWEAAQALDDEASPDEYDVEGAAVGDEAESAAGAEGQVALPGLDEEDPVAAAQQRREEARQRVQRLREAQARLRAEVAEVSGASDGPEASDGEDGEDGEDGDEQGAAEGSARDEDEDTAVSGGDGDTSAPARGPKKRPRDGRTLRQPSSDLDALRRLSDEAGPGDE